MSDTSVNNLKVSGVEGPSSKDTNEVGTLPNLPAQPGGQRPRRSSSIFDPTIVRQSIGPSFAKLDPRVQFKNPVMFVVEVGSIITTIIFIAGFFNGASQKDQFFVGFTSLWLWFTVVFANFAEAMAEGRGKA